MFDVTLTVGWLRTPLASLGMMKVLAHKLECVWGD